jgi:acyl-homoserine-lactone acylase
MVGRYRIETWRLNARRTDMTRALAWIGLCGAIAAGCGSDSDNVGGPGDGNYTAKIVRTEYGIPHISANDWGSLGFGTGYAYAQDNYCVLMREIVRANGESMRWLGEEGGGNLADDLVYRFFSSDQYIETEFIPAADENLQALVRGYASGLNKYLEETGLDSLPEGPEGCRGEDWVRPVTEVDLAKVYRKLILRAGVGALSQLILAAEAPTMSMAAGPAVIGPQSLAFNEDALNLPKTEAAGSNAYAIGKEGSQTDYGILLGNPHFPWTGSLRWYIQHLTIPGVYDVMGAALQGIPIVNIGFNKDLAWTHTVSTGQRFTFYELHLLEDDPMRYTYDDEDRDIETLEVTIEVLQEDGSVVDQIEEIYMTDYGPIVDLAPLSELVGGWPTGFNSVVAVRDANIDNARALVQWQAINASSSVEELLEALKILGIPWVNTIAADRGGTGLYADVSTVPHVTADKLEDCTDSIITNVVTDLGRATLNGSRSDCAWGSDPETPEGLLGFDNLPKLATGPGVPYTANANDSYWLANPNNLLEGFSPLIGREDVPQSLRTRQAFVQAEERIAGTDGLGDTPGFTVELLQQVMFGNRNIAEELTRADVLAICDAVADWNAGDCDETAGNQPYSANPEQAEAACGVLADWDGLFNVDSVGAMIWTEFWRFVQSTEDLWAVPFDPNDPVGTPNTLNDENPDVVEAVRCALGQGVDFMVDNGIPLDRPWGEVQFRPVGDDEQIPIHGGNPRFMFSAISAQFVDQVGYANIPTGNSYIQTVTWDETECPDAYAVLTYSQSTNPESPHYADMTRLYSEKGWNDMPFCPEDIEATKISEIEIEGSEGATEN